jgi:hypothetical protein
MTSCVGCKYMATSPFFHIFPHFLRSQIPSAPKCISQDLAPRIPHLLLYRSGSLDDSFKWMDDIPTMIFWAGRKCTTSSPFFQLQSSQKAVERPPKNPNMSSPSIVQQSFDPNIASLLLSLTTRLPRARSFRPLWVSFMLESWIPLSPRQCSSRSST